MQKAQKLILVIVPMYSSQFKMVFLLDQYSGVYGYKVYFTFYLVPYIMINSFRNEASCCILIF